MAPDIADRLGPFSATVEKIYDAAVDLQLWPAALQAIVDLTGATAGGMQRHSDPGASDELPHMMVHVGLQPLADTFTRETWMMWFLQANFAAWQPGEINLLAEMMSRAEFENGRFYREVLKPFKPVDFLGMLALREGPHAVYFSINRHDNAETFSAEDIRIARLLAPHVCRAIKIGFALELKQLRVRNLEATLDVLAAGIFLTNATGRILHMNQTAQRLAREGHGFKISNNQLVPKDAAAASALARQFARNGHAMERGADPVSIAMPDRNGGLISTVLPLSGGRREDLLSGWTQAAYAIFVQNPAATPPMPGEAFGTLYDLTPAELKVVRTLATGYGPQDAADILGLSPATVKTHLQRIFQKTGTRRQIELARLFTQSNLPLAIQA